MQFKDLLRGTVLLIAVEATALGAISAVAINNSGEEALATFAIGFWLVSIVAGMYLGQLPRAVEALAGPLAAAKTSTQLPSESPGRVAFGRLWPIGLFALLAGGLGLIWPQVPAIATGFALAVALSWRNREAAVTAIEERDGVCFYVEPTSALEPVKLVRTPGLMRGGARMPPGTA